MGFALASPLHCSHRRLRRPRLKMEAMSHAREKEVVKEGLIDHSGMYTHISGSPRCLSVLPHGPRRAAAASCRPELRCSGSRGGSRAGIVFALLARRSASWLSSLVKSPLSAFRSPSPPPPPPLPLPPPPFFFFHSLLLCVLSVFSRAGDDSLFPL